MSESVDVNAQPRQDAGKGASRRLRRNGRVPGIVYGAQREPQLVSLAHNELAHHLEEEGFYSRILDLKVGDKVEKVVIKDLQRHPARPFLLHVDFQRIIVDEKIRMTVPLHFVDEATSKGVKQGGRVAHNITEVEVSCLPKDLPEFIEIDMSEMDIGDSVHLSEIRLPEDVALAHAPDPDVPVVSIHSPQAQEEESERVGRKVPNLPSLKIPNREVAALPSRLVTLKQRELGPGVQWPTRGIRLIVGLGNPGSQYETTRHNVGYWLVDALAADNGGQFRVDNKFRGLLCRVLMSGHDLRLLKPITFMNRRGQSVAAVARYFDIAPDQMLVAHDELDLPVGTLRLKQGGGHAGHNGLRDIVNVLGTRDFWRLRIGIGHPGDKEQVVNYVLSCASRSDEGRIREALNDAGSSLTDVIAGEFQRAMNGLHSAS